MAVLLTIVFPSSFLLLSQSFLILPPPSSYSFLFFSSSFLPRSHFEKRIYMNEFMTGSISSNPIKSPLSLAVFEDTGWYKINYDGAQVLDWGNGLGCSFAEEKCSRWPQAATDRGYDKERAHHCVMTFEHDLIHC